MATDNFNRANGDVGANWTKTSASGFNVESNQCIAAAADYCLARYSGASFNADHYSQVIAVATTAYNGITARHSAGTDCYVWWFNLSGTTGNVYRVDDGSFTELQTGIAAPADGSICKITVEGSSIKLYDDGAQVGSTQTDSTYASGSPGIFGFDGGGGTRPFMDDWEGANMVAATKARPIFPQPRRFFRRSA